MKVENELAMDKRFFKISPFMRHIWVLHGCYELYLPEKFYTKEILSQWHNDIHCSMAYNSEKQETNINLQKEG